MKSNKFFLTFFLFFMSLHLFAQKVHYKDNYYTIVKSKIFHRGHDVYGKLTAGARDTIHIIAKELYTERGKLKDKYKSVPRRERYKLPQSFWEQNTLPSNVVVSASAVVAAEEISITKKAADLVQLKKPIEKTAATILANESIKNVKDEVVEKEKVISKKELISEKDHKVEKTEKAKEVENTKQEKSDHKEEEKAEEKEGALKEKIEEQKDNKKEGIAQRTNEKEAREQAQKEGEQKQLAEQREEANRKKEKALKKKEKEEREKERKRQKIEKEKKRKEKELKQKEKAISNHKSAQKRLKKSEKKYKKLKEKGELSPIEEKEWLEKIEKLKEKVTIKEKKMHKS